MRALGTRIYLVKKRLGLARVGCIKTPDLPVLHNPQAYPSHRNGYASKPCRKNDTGLLLECALFLNEISGCLNADAGNDEGSTAVLGVKRHG